MKRSSGSGKPRSRTRGGSSTALKSDPNVGNIPVIMVTPVHESGIGVSLGASGFVTKPVDRAKLRALLNRFCNPDSGPVLVVDDDPDSRDLARHAIEQLGLKAVEAENGAVALDWLADHSPPSLILLDIMMPVMDGVEFLDLFRRNVAWSDVPVVVVTAKELTGKDRDVLDLVLLDVMTPQCNGYEVLERKGANRRLSEVPVVMLSAQGEIDSVVRCIELGAVDFLQKPFNPVLLRARVGATLEKKRLRDEGARHLVRLEQELDAGRKLQMAMVPTIFPPPTPDQPVEIFAMMEPAREVGGDLYDFFTAEDGTFCFLVGDVSGKGVASALVMARTMTLVRTLTGMVSKNGRAPLPGEVVARVNQELCIDNDSMMFVTLFFAMLNPSTGELTFCNAGHDPPFWLRDDGLDRLHGTRSMAVGVFAEAVYTSDRATLEAGETLFVFTDGITEAIAASGDMFTEAGIVSVLQERTTAPLEELVHAVGDALSAFVGDSSAFDDITALAVRRAYLTQ